MKLEDIISKKNEIVEKMRGMLDLVEKENRSLTADEEKAYAELETRLDQVNKDIKRTEKLEEEEKRLAAPASEAFRYSGAPVKPTEAQKFTCLGEFFHSVRYNQNDNRLVPGQTEVREQNMAVGEQGGFMVPEEFIPELLKVNPQEAIFRPRCRVIPNGSAPDTTVSMPALDQSSAQNMYGGVTIYPTAEGGDMKETDAKLKELELTPHEQGAYIKVTNKLLRNWQAAGAVLTALLRDAMIAYEDTKYYNGNGVAVPLGVINSPAAISISRNTASQVVAADIRSMYARLKFGGSPIWITSQTTLPYLMALADSLGNLLWNTNLVGKQPGTLMGIPVMLNDRSVALGTKGDLVLADLSYYLIKDGLGITIGTSEHVYYTSNKTVFRALFSIDGKPWLTAPIPLEGSTSNTISPFIVLE